MKILYRIVIFSLTLVKALRINLSIRLFLCFKLNLEILAKKQGFEIIVVNPTVKDQEDLMQDFASIITFFCARLYSGRRAKHKTEEVLQILQKGNSDETS